MDPFTLLLINLFSLASRALQQLFIPFFVGGVILTLLFNFVQKKTHWKWIGSTILTLFLAFTLFFLLIHSWNIWNGLTAFDPTQVPPPIQENPEYAQSQLNPFSWGGRAVIVSLIAGVLFTLVVLPFSFLAVSLFDALKKRFPGFWMRMGIVSYASAVFFILLIILFPWIPVSLVYLAFFGL
jgi:hypothetical protein